jgi:hypothetical protein
VDGTALPAGFRFQPVDAGEVAENLVQLALGAPAGQAPDIAGPRIYEAEYLRVRMPGAAAAAIRAGANLAPDRAVGRRTWEDFLATEIGSQIPRGVKSESS